MRIVQVAPDFLPVPPPLYGGIERIVFDLVEELAARGHEVFLYALPGSETKAKLIPYRHQNDVWKIVEHVVETLPEKVDIIHDHTHGSVLGCSSRRFTAPVVCSIHIPWWNQVEHPVFPSRMMQHLVGSGAGYTVHHGMNPTRFPLCAKKSGYLLFLGRLNREKGIAHAIEVARKTGKQLVIAGPALDVVEPEKHQYYLEEIAPKLLPSEGIFYVGELSDADKVPLLQHAECLLFPSETESFGLVMIEAMACGTPVLAFGNGSVPEILKDFPELICSDTDAMVEKLGQGQFPTPVALRDYFNQRFTSAKMVDNYLSVYQQVIGMGV